VNIHCYGGITNPEKEVKEAEKAVV